MSLRFWFICFPDIAKPIGGVKQMHRCAEALIFIGHQATIIQDSIDFQPSWFTSTVPILSKDQWDKLDFLSPEKDFIVLAETFSPVFLSYYPEFQKIIFNQNASYTFGLPSEKHHLTPLNTLNKYSHSSIAQCWCVSENDYRLITLGFGVPLEKVFIIRNSMDVSNLSVPKYKQRRIAYMPRKNQIDSTIVTQLLQRKSWLDGWEFVAIDGLSHQNVLKILQTSAIFLSFGHPEGFGLPVGEAFSCGCAVVGYHGLGGRELFILGSKYQLAIAVEIGDWLGFIEGVSQIVNNLNLEPEFYQSQVQLLSDEIKDLYSVSVTRSCLQKAVSALR